MCRTRAVASSSRRLPRARGPGTPSRARFVGAIAPEVSAVRTPSECEGAPRDKELPASVTFRGQISMRDQRGARPGHGRARRLEPAVGFVPFFGREAAYATPRVTHEWRAASVRKPTGTTKSHPDGERPPGPRSNGFAPGSRSNPTVWEIGRASCRERV